jgi:hypothetical protein
MKSLELTQVKDGSLVYFDEREIEEFMDAKNSVGKYSILSYPTKGIVVKRRITTSGETIFTLLVDRFYRMSEFGKKYALNIVKCKEGDLHFYSASNLY